MYETWNSCFEQLDKLENIWKYLKLNLNVLKPRIYSSVDMITEIFVGLINLQFFTTWSRQLCRKIWNQSFVL